MPPPPPPPLPQLPPPLLTPPLPPRLKMLSEWSLKKTFGFSHAHKIADCLIQTGSGIKGKQKREKGINYCEGNGRCYIRQPGPKVQKINRKLCEGNLRRYVQQSEPKVQYLKKPRKLAWKANKGARIKGDTQSQNYIQGLGTLE